jgi:hypothetical protein
VLVIAGVELRLFHDRAELAPQLCEAKTRSRLGSKKGASSVDQASKWGRTCRSLIVEAGFTVTRVITVWHPLGPIGAGAPGLSEIADGTGTCYTRLAAGATRRLRLGPAYQRRWGAPGCSARPVTGSSPRQ